MLVVGCAQSARALPCPVHSPAAFGGGVGAAVGAATGVGACVGRLATSATDLAAACAEALAAGALAMGASVALIAVGAKVLTGAPCNLGQCVIVLPAV